MSRTNESETPSANKETNDGSPPSAEEASEQPQLKPLFQTLKENENAMLSFAEGFRDKVRVLFEHFDVDGDGRLKFDELAALQLATSGDSLSKELYAMACQSLNCHPDQGLSLEALKFTYAADGASIDEDYDKVFDEHGQPRPRPAEESKEEEDDGEEKVYEIAANGVVDISS